MAIVEQDLGWSLSPGQEIRKLVLGGVGGAGTMGVNEASSFAFDVANSVICHISPIVL